MFSFLNSKLWELGDPGGDGGDPLLRCVARLRLSNLDGYGFLIKNLGR